MMLYTKYESSGLCSFRPKDFWKLHFENLVFDRWLTYATNCNDLNNFGKGTTRDHFCEVWSKFNEWFQRKKLFKEIVDAQTDTWTLDDGQWAITKAYLEHFVLRWAKKKQKILLVYFSSHLSLQETPAMLKQERTRSSRTICEADFSSSITSCRLLAPSRNERLLICNIEINGYSHIEGIRDKK